MKTEDFIYFKQDMAQPNKYWKKKIEYFFFLTILGIHSHDACMVRFDKEFLLVTDCHLLLLSS